MSQHKQVLTGITWPPQWPLKGIFNSYLILACHQRHLVAQRGFAQCFVYDAAFAKVLVKDESVSVLK